MKYARDLLMDEYHKQARFIQATEATIDRMHRNKKIPFHCMAEVLPDIMDARSKQDSIAELLAIIPLD